MRGDLILEETDIGKAIQSQLGSIELKRKKLAQRLWLKRLVYSEVPRKRVGMTRPDFFAACSLILEDRIVAKSKCEFARQREDYDRKRYERSMFVETMLLKLVNYLSAKTKCLAGWVSHG